MYKAVICIIAAFLCTYAYGAIGKLTEVTGPTQISRETSKIIGKIESDIEMNDIVETLRSRAGITFEDNTRVQITEYSKLVIDDFVYDPASGKGKLSIKAAFGTVRYASGIIAKNSRENIKVTTPTAKISVRGTDFSMTVSEDGKSLIVLLPSKPLSAGILPVVGSIEVSNFGGTVVLDKAYQATFISSMQTSPTRPVVLEFQDESKINNMLVVESPKAVTQTKDGKKNNDKQSANDNNADDSKSNKKVKTVDTPTQVAQVEAVAAPVGADIKEEPVTVLDINALNPEVLKAVISAMDTTALPPITWVPIDSTGFVSNGVTATYFRERNNNIISYTTKANTSLTLTVKDITDTQTILFGFGEKLKINIIQTPAK